MHLNRSTCISFITRISWSLSGGHHASALIILHYTPASQADACVYSRDDPCGHHASQNVIMLRKMSSCFAKCHHASAVIMEWGRSSRFCGHHASQNNEWYLTCLRRLKSSTPLDLNRTM